MSEAVRVWEENGGAGGEGGGARQPEKKARIRGWKECDVFVVCMCMCVCIRGVAIGLALLAS